MTAAVGAAMAHPNIALVKYWGKEAGGGNRPAVESLSITLDGLETRTQVAFEASAGDDELWLDGAAAPVAARDRVSRFLDRLRPPATRAIVHTANSFPFGAGLASSASGFAALALAASRAAGRPIDAAALSHLARQGSGSAARSVFGGFCRMCREGDEVLASPLLPAAAWPLRVVVAITSRAAKGVGSTEGMERTRRTAPFYPAWLAAQPEDMGRATAAVRARDFTALGEVAEHSCLKMHGLAMAARPPLLYWNPATVGGMHTVQALRAEGLPVFFTIDAGPQLKAVCLPEAAVEVAAALRDVPGVLEVLTVGLGEGVRALAPFAEGAA